MLENFTLHILNSSILVAFKKLWKLVAIVVNASLFWTGATFVCTAVFPLIIIFSKNKTQKNRWARLCIQYTFKVFLWSLELWQVIKIKKTGLEKLSDMRGHYLICNHPTLIDTVIIMAHFKDIQCIVKGELWSHPILGMIVRTAGYIPNNAPPEEFLKICQQQLDNGFNILIFPEGTRTRHGSPLTLKRGLSNLALATNHNIQALTLSINNPLLTKEVLWYTIPDSRSHIDLTFGKLFLLDECKQELPRPIRARALTKSIQNYYNGFLGYEWLRFRDKKSHYYIA